MQAEQEMKQEKRRLEADMTSFMEVQKQLTELSHVMEKKVLLYRCWQLNVCASADDHAVVYGPDCD
jgi:hypothetical protein